MLNDVVEGVRVCDALPHIDFVMSMFLPSDIDPEISDLRQRLLSQYPELLAGSQAEPVGDRRRWGAA